MGDDKPKRDTKVMINDTLILEVLKNTKEDAEVLHQWRKDPVASEMSFHHSFTEDAFWEYYQKYFTLKDLPSLFVRVGSERIGFIGFTPYIDRNCSHRKAAEVSILLSPEWRQKHLGAKSLDAAGDFSKQQGYDDLFAKIKPKNAVSIQLFEKHGFEYIGEHHEIIDEDGILDHVPCRLFCKNITPKSAKRGVYVVGEAGSNWRLGTPKRDLQMAKTLIEIAKDAGCDAVKFQTFKADTVYAPNAGFCDYLHADADIHEIFEDLTMPYEMLQELHKICQECAIDFMSTPFSIEDFAHVDPFVLRHKIASYELSHIRLLEKAAQSQKPVYLSTGACTLEDVAWAVSTYKKFGGKALTLLQCSAQYPAEDSQMNLKALLTLKQYFGLPVGLSDHSRHPTSAPVSAASLGATYIEKHFTLDRRLVGPDHSFAIEPDELKEMVRAIRHTEEMLGTGIKEVLDGEKELFLFAKRRIQATKEIARGDLLQENDNIAILRPGRQKGGCHPKFLEVIEGKRATRAIHAGEGIGHGDWQ